MSKRHTIIGPVSPWATKGLPGFTSTAARSHTVGASMRVLRRHARRLIGLPASVRALVLASGILVPLVQLALRLLPARLLLRGVERIVRLCCRRRRPAVEARQVGWAVEVVSRRVPGATCLARALAARVLLALSGYPSRLRIGVARDERKHFHAHAWVECEGRVVIGDVGLDSYTILPDLPGSS